MSGENQPQLSSRKIEKVAQASPAPRSISPSPRRSLFRFAIDTLYDLWGLIIFIWLAIKYGVLRAPRLTEDWLSRKDELNSARLLETSEAASPQKPTYEVKFEGEVDIDRFPVIKIVQKDDNGEDVRTFRKNEMDIKRLIVKLRCHYPTTKERLPSVRRRTLISRLPLLGTSDKAIGQSLQNAMKSLLSNRLYANSFAMKLFLEQLDLSGKVAIVTGANSGIGKETAKSLARLGARVIFASRSKTRTLPILEALRKEPNMRGEAEFMELDLSSFQSTRRFASDFISLGTNLDYLILNAGHSDPRREKTAEGFEAVFGTNYIGHSLLASLLMPTLRKVSKPRLVFVSSEGHYFYPPPLDLSEARLRTSATNFLESFKRYSSSKRAQVMLVRALALREKERSGGPQIRFYAPHPGRVMTNIFHELTEKPIRANAFMNFLYNFLVREVDGNFASVICALDPRLDNYSGHYLNEFGVICQSGGISGPIDDKDCLALLQRTEELIGRKFDV